jgi:tRNA A37 methylthiotransferase MiaB
MREKTHAHRRMKDNVPEEVKLRRLSEIIQVFHKGALAKNTSRVGQRELILIDGVSKRDPNRLRGRTDGNHKVIIDNIPIPDRLSGGKLTPIRIGDYVEVVTTSATTTSFQGTPLARTDLVTYHQTYH